MVLVECLDFRNSFMTAYNKNYGELARSLLSSP